jgi:predicted phage gp36 major capsid-like protein
MIMDDGKLTTLHTAARAWALAELDVVTADNAYRAAAQVIAEARDTEPLTPDMVDARNEAAADLDQKCRQEEKLEGDLLAAARALL